MSELRGHKSAPARDPVLPDEVPEVRRHHDEGTLRRTHQPSRAMRREQILPLKEGGIILCHVEMEQGPQEWGR